MTNKPKRDRRTRRKRWQVLEDEVQYNAEELDRTVVSKDQIRTIIKTFKEKMEKNIIFLRAIDSKNGKKIQLEDIRNYDIVGLVGKNTSRNMAHLIFEKELPVSEQVELMNEFNRQLNRERNKYFSFFLTNFRDNNRKRISFDMAYKFLNYI